MQKKFQSRFMPDVKFFMPNHLQDKWCSIFYNKNESKYKLPFWATSKDGDFIYHNGNYYGDYLALKMKEVSVYEAIPELIPDGMRYNKDLDKLVPNIIENEKVKKVITNEKFYITNIPMDIEKVQNLLEFIEGKYTPEFIQSVIAASQGVLYHNGFDYCFSYPKVEKPKDYHTVTTYNDLLANYLPKDTKAEILQFADLSKGGFISQSPTSWAKEQLKFAKSLEADIDINKLSSVFPNKDEKINLRENGFFKADLDKTDFTLVCPYAYEDLAKQLTIGAKKYERDNWQKGDILTYIAALERHINDVKKALIENDNKALIDDTGINQGGALMFNSMAIHYFIRKILSGDENVK